MDHPHNTAQWARDHIPGIPVPVTWIPKLGTRALPQPRGKFHLIPTFALISHWSSQLAWPGPSILSQSSWCGASHCSCPNSQRGNGVNLHITLKGSPWLHSQKLPVHREYPPDWITDFAMLCIIDGPLYSAGTELRRGEHSVVLVELIVSPLIHNHIVYQPPTGRVQKQVRNVNARHCNRGQIARRR